ncbi:MAG: tetratricopeptide repeat protein, partial [Bacteroidia bacterium]
MLLRLNKSNDSTKIVLYCLIADSYVDDKKINLGLNYIDSAFILSRKINKPRSEAYVFNMLGNIYNYLNDFNKALDNFERASVINKKINNKTGLISNFINLGNSYFYSGNSKKAEVYYRKALFIYNTGQSDLSTLSNIY